MCSIPFPFSYIEFLVYTFFSPLLSSLMQLAIFFSNYPSPSSPFYPPLYIPSPLAKSFGIISIYFHFLPLTYSYGSIFSSTRSFCIINSFFESCIDLQKERNEERDTCGWFWEERNEYICRWVYICIPWP